MQTAIAPAPHTPAPGDHDYAVTGIDSRKLGMWGFLASECLFFGALISSYLLYRSRAPQGVKLPHDVYDIPYTSVSSFVLLMSSLTMVLALAAIQRATTAASGSGSWPRPAPGRSSSAGRSTSSRASPTRA